MTKFNINIKFTLLILIILVFYRYKTIKHSILNNKIVSVYNTYSYFGIGDYMRGIIHLYQNEISDNIYINYKDNEISNYLYNGNNNDHSYDDKQIFITNESNYQYNISNEINYLYHNAAITYPIKKEILVKIKNMFIMKPQFKLTFNEKLLEQNLIKDKFAVLHLRYDDKVFNKDDIIQIHKLNNYIEKIKRKWKNNILIISNSKETKNYLANKYKLKKFSTVPVHTGIIGNFDKTQIQDTLIEFFVMTKCKEIYQYCQNSNQISGFSKRISEIYSIPINIITL